MVTSVRRRARLPIAIGLVALAALAPIDAHACSGALPTTASRVLPPDGAIDVSTATSIYVVTSKDPDTISVTAGGQPVALGQAESFGSDVMGEKIWKLTPTNPNEVSPMLAPSTEYVVDVGKADSGVENSRFTTGPGYDKEPGTPPVVKSLRVFRVHYQISEIGAGRCVFDEYVGFISFDFEPAVIPNTAPAGELYGAHVQPSHGSSQQSTRFTGEAPYVGRDPTPDPYPNPETDWTLELDATREYCLWLDATGAGELARQTLTSNQVCAPVEEITMPGATPGRAGGCSQSGRPSGSAAWALVLVALGMAARRTRK